MTRADHLLAELIRRNPKATIADYVREMARIEAARKPVRRYPKLKYITRVRA